MMNVVKATVPADRLLVFDVKEGWGPLCTFLGVPVPEKPFPQVNDAADFKKRSVRMKRVAWATVIVPVVLSGVALWSLSRTGVLSSWTRKVTLFFTTGASS